MHEFPIPELPGTAFLKVEILEKNIFGQGVLLGYTEIDLEERTFSL